VDKTDSAPQVGDVNPLRTRPKADRCSQTFDACGWILDNLSTENRLLRHLFGVYYILVLFRLTPHIWGYCFLSQPANFRTFGLIVHRQEQFSTVLSELSTVLRLIRRSCLNKYAYIWALR
jgi:hypothetical protein